MNFNIPNLYHTCPDLSDYPYSTLSCSATPPSPDSENIGAYYRGLSQSAPAPRSARPGWFADRIKESHIRSLVYALA